MPGRVNLRACGRAAQLSSLGPGHGLLCDPNPYALTPLTGLAMSIRVPLGVQLSSLALDLAMGRSVTLEHLEELDRVRK